MIVCTYLQYVITSINSTNSFTLIIMRINGCLHGFLATRKIFGTNYFCIAEDEFLHRFPLVILLENYEVYSSSNHELCK